MTWVAESGKKLKAISKNNADAYPTLPNLTVKKKSVVCSGLSNTGPILLLHSADFSGSGRSFFTKINPIVNGHDSKRETNNFVVAQMMFCSFEE